MTSFAFNEVLEKNIKDCNDNDKFSKLEFENDIVFVVFLNGRKDYTPQKSVIDSLNKIHGFYVDYLIVKFDGETRFFNQDVLANHYKLFSSEFSNLVPFMDLGSTEAANRFLKLKVEDCTSDKEMTQLRISFIPKHDIVASRVRAAFEVHSIRKDLKGVSLKLLNLEKELSVVRNEISGDNTPIKNTFNFYLQIGTSFGFEKNYAIINDQGNSRISSERSSGLNLRFSVSPSQPIFKLGEKSNVLNIGIQFSDNQQQLEGEVNQRDSEEILPNAGLYVEINSGVIRESLRTRVISVPVLIKTELKGDETFALGSICGFQLNRLIGSSYQVVSGSYDAQAYSSGLNEVINDSELGLINGNKISNERGELSLKHTSLNPTVGFYLERKFDANRSFHTELTFNPMFRFDVLNTEGGMIATSASNYNGLFNGVNRVSLPLVSLMIGFSI